jgi:lysophospholipase L1-like esterase
MAFARSFDNNPARMKLVALCCAMLITSLAAAVAQMDSAVFQSQSRILFQGDSITDANRGRNGDSNYILGHGYAFLIAARFGAQYPERQLTFINRGISGNKVPDLAARWQKDTVDLKPDVVSILIGVNDIWHTLNAGQEVSPEKYEAGYDQLLAETVAALPKARLVLCEPFILPGSATKGQWELWQAHAKKFSASVEKLGAKYHAPVVHFQKMFDDAAKRAPAEYWIRDGVHPTSAGHQLMADEWARTVSATWPAAP